MAALQGLDEGQQALNKSVMCTLVNDGTLGRCADLTVVLVDTAPAQALDSLCDQLGIVSGFFGDDQGIVAAQLQNDLLNGGSSVHHHLGAGVGGTGHGDAGNLLISQQGLGAVFTAAGDKVQNFLGHASLVSQIDQLLDAAGSSGGSLDDHGVTGQQSGNDLLQGQLDGIVEGDNAGDNAQSLMTNQNNMVFIALGAVGQDFAIHMLADFDVGTADLSSIGGLCTRLQNGLAHFTGHVVCDLFTVTVDQVAELIQDLATLKQRHLFPVRLCGVSDVDHFGDLFCIVIGYAAN